MEDDANSGEKLFSGRLWPYVQYLALVFVVVFSFMGKQSIVAWKLSFVVILPTYLLAKYKTGKMHSDYNSGTLSGAQKFIYRSVYIVGHIWIAWTFAFFLYFPFYY